MKELLSLWLYCKPKFNTPLVHTGTSKFKDPLIRNNLLLNEENGFVWNYKNKSLSALIDDIEGDENNFDSIFLALYVFHFYNQKVWPEYVSKILCNKDIFDKMHEGYFFLPATDGPNGRFSVEMTDKGEKYLEDLWNSILEGSKGYLWVTKVAHFFI